MPQSRPTTTSKEGEYITSLISQYINLVQFSAPQSYSGGDAANNGSFWGYLASKPLGSQLDSTSGRACARRRRRGPRRWCGMESANPQPLRWSWSGRISRTQCSNWSASDQLRKCRQDSKVGGRFLEGATCLFLRQQLVLDGK